MRSGSDYWARYWRNLIDPQNNKDGAGLHFWASEYRCILDQKPFRSVLELACGTGDFYKRLGFDQCDYLGVDFSPRMLETFQKNFPDARLRQGDASKLIPEGRFDLVVSSQLLQYLTVAEVRLSIANMAGALEPGGRIIHLGVPWDALRWQYYSGAIDGRPGGTMAKAKAGVAASLEWAGLRPAIGHWHSLNRLRAIGTEFGLSAAFHGSLTQPYRFHVCFTRTQD